VTTKKAQTKKDESRIIYETLRSGRVSDSHWCKIKRCCIQASIPLDLDGLTLVVNLQKISKRLVADISTIRHLVSDKISASEMTGAQIKAVVTKMGVFCHYSTFIRWFYKLGVEYRENQYYSSSTVALVLLQAKVYAVKQKTRFKGATK
jgi:hypothetical protein